MIKMSKSLIKNLNLTEHQAAVYLAALELGQAPMQDLARKSGVKRTTIYKFIDELRERGLILETRHHKRNFYSGVAPEQLVELQKNHLVELEDLMPELKAVQNRAKNKPKVMFYEGLEAIKEMYTDTLKEKKPIVALSDFSNTDQALGKFIENYPDERARKNITLQWIIPDTPEAREFTKRDYGLLRETKFLPNAHFKIDLNIYGNKVSLVKAGFPHPFAVLIEDPDVAETFREAWKQLWERL